MQKEPPYVPRKHQRNSIQGQHQTPLGICFPITEPLHFTEHKTEAVQRRSAPFVFGYYNYGPTSGLTHDIHHRLKWTPLQHRRALYDLALFYKIRSNVININFPPIVQPSSRQPNRCLSNRHSTPMPTSTIFLIAQFELGILYQIKPFHQQTLLILRR